MDGGFWVDDAEFGKNEECGVFAAYAPGAPVIAMTYNGLLDLQGRGQQGAGVAFLVQEGDTAWPQVISGEGLVPVALNEISPDNVGHSAIDPVMASPVAIGHVRYTTAGGPKGLQPRANLNTGLTFATNGHIEDIDYYAKMFGVDSSEAVSDSDTFFRIINDYTERYGDLQQALDVVLPGIEGAYSVVMSVGETVIGFRDPNGFRPLVLGKLRDHISGFVLASETVALDGCNAEVIRDIEPGEIVTIDQDGVHSRRFAPANPSLCSFEAIYFARKESILEGSPVYDVRKCLGKYLAEKYPIDADVVVGVPSSGIPAAHGYSEATGIPVKEGIFKSEYSGRTFILDGQQQQNALRRKYRINTSEVAGKRVIVIDDSYIKGLTQGALREMFTESGATEVYVLSSAARYRNPCHQGMATSDPSKLVARHLSVEEMRVRIGADFLGFNDPGDVERAMNEVRQERGLAPRQVGSMCVACMTGEYPLSTPAFDRLNALGKQVVDLGMPFARRV